jgi:N-acetylglutamate synthase-like GNAT family acetyltransferase
VGGGLIACALDEARASGLRYVFACTVDERAESFFDAGFVRVPPDSAAGQVDRYDCERRARLKVLRCNLE